MIKNDLSLNLKYIKQMISKSSVPPDVIAISETRLNKDNENSVKYLVTLLYFSIL